MKKIFSFTCFVLFLFFFFSSCQSCKKDEKPIVYIPLDTTFLSYCAFPVGSWWSYKEINTGQRDSFYVTRTEQEAIRDHHSDLDYYKLIYHITNLNDTFYYSTKPFYFSTYYTFVLYEIYNAYNGTHIAARFFSPYNNDTLYNYGCLYLKMSIDTMTINGHLYNNIKVMENKASTYGNKIKTEYYCKNVGVIRKELFNGEIWEIKNYHINQ